MNDVTWCATVLLAAQVDKGDRIFTKHLSKMANAEFYVVLDRQIDFMKDILHTDAVSTV